MRTLLLLFKYGFLLFIYLFLSDCCTKTFRTMLNDSGESGHPFLVPDLRRNAFSFSPLRIMFACRLIIHGLYYAEVGSFYAHFFEEF